MANAMNKPVYAVAESFKFLRIYPLKQKEIPNQYKVSYHSVLLFVKLLCLSHTQRFRESIRFIDIWDHPNRMSFKREGLARIGVPEHVYENFAIT